MLGAKILVKIKLIYFYLLMVNLKEREIVQARFTLFGWGVDTDSSKYIILQPKFPTISEQNVNAIFAKITRGQKSFKICFQTFQNISQKTQKGMNFSSMASKPTNIRWIKTGSQLY